MSPHKIHKLKFIFTANTGCVCPKKVADVIEPQTKSKPSSFSDQKSTLLPSSSSSAYRRHHFTLLPKIHDSFAVVKDSDNPYQDFRRSMLQMILEKEIYSRKDLQQLLDCFLSLNSPHHHHVIIRAFIEIWNGVLVAETAPPP